MVYYLMIEKNYFWRIVGELVKDRYLSDQRVVYYCYTFVVTRYNTLNKIGLNPYNVIGNYPRYFNIYIF